MKELCDCGKMATWIYVPDGWFKCDDCVSRGCTCQLDLEDDERLPDFNNFDEYNKFKQELRDGTNPFVSKHARDEQGRLLPCVEFFYSEEGFDEGTDGIDIIESFFENRVK